MNVISPLLALLFAVQPIQALSAEALSAEALGEQDIFGPWLTHEGGEVSFHNCGEALCGTVTRLRPADELNPPKDINNPDPALRDRALLGLTMFTGYQYKGDGRWKGGVIYNSNDGKTYKSKLKLNEDGTLKMQGCIMFFCRSFIWRRPERAVVQEARND